MEITFFGVLVDFSANHFFFFWVGVVGISLGKVLTTD